MRFAFLQPTLDIFGGTRRIIEMTNRLVDRGHEVCIYHPAGTPCEWLPGKADVKKTEAIHEEGVEYDVLLFNFPTQYDDAIAARARLKIFFVLELYKSEILTGLQRLQLLRPRYRRMRALKRCLDGPFMFMANATWMAEWIEKHRRTPCELVIGGLAHDVFHVPEGGSHPVPGRVLASGDRRVHKGTAEVKAAIEIAKKQVPNLTFETYHGRGIPQSGMAELYASASIFVDGQYHAGWCNPVIEAMACGTPVVATDIGGVRDFAFNEKTALLVPPRDPEAMAAAIVRLMNDRELRETLVANALEHVQKFRWEPAMDRFLEAVETGMQRFAGAA